MYYCFAWLLITDVLVLEISSSLRTRATFYFFSLPPGPQFIFAQRSPLIIICLMAIRPL